MRWKIYFILFLGMFLLVIPLISASNEARILCISGQEVKAFCNFAGREVNSVGALTPQPLVTIFSPLPQNYNTNNSMSLNFTASVPGGVVSSCSYEVINSTGYVNIGNTSLPGLANTTFSLPGGDIDYDLTIYCNNSVGSIGYGKVTFGIRTVAPVIVLQYPSDGSWFKTAQPQYFNFLPTANTPPLSKCDFYLNTTGTWAINQTFTSPSSGVQIAIPKNISNGYYAWNANCTDAVNNSDFALNNFSIGVDNIPPQIDSIAVTTTTGSQTFTLNITTSDNLALNLCQYTILNSTGGVDPATTYNKSYTCNTLQTATVSAYANYTVNATASDRAGNVNSSTYNFTVSPSTGGTIGGGGSINLIANITRVPVVALLKSGLDNGYYSDLERAIFYKAVSDYCNNNTFAGRCSTSQSLLSQLSLGISDSYKKTISTDSLKIWIGQYEANQIENIYVDKSLADQYKLVIAQIIKQVQEFAVNPKNIDELKLILSGNQVIRTVEANAPLQSCKVESGDVGFSCKISNSTAIITYDIPPETFTFKSVEARISYTSINSQSFFQTVKFRNISTLGLLIILIFLATGGLVYWKFRKKIKWMFKKFKSKIAKLIK